MRSAGPGGCGLGSTHPALPITMGIFSRSPWALGSDRCLSQLCWGLSMGVPTHHPTSKGKHGAGLSSEVRGSWGKGGGMGSFF